jgi:hypothetical protein
MDWKVIERCWRILNEFEQLWDSLSSDNCLILRPVPALAGKPQLRRCEIDPAKPPLDPNRFQIE